jgi:hypothetical protein
MMRSVFVVDALATSVGFKFYGSGGRGEKRKRSGRHPWQQLWRESSVLFVNERSRSGNLKLELVFEQGKRRGAPRG